MDEAARVALGPVIDCLTPDSPLVEVRFVLFSPGVLTAYETALRTLCAGPSVDREIGDRESAD